MSNAVANFFYIPMLVVTVGVIVITFARHSGKNLAPSFLFYALMTLGWQVCEAVFTNTRSTALARLLFDLKLPFVALAALGGLLYVLRFYGLEDYCPPPVAVCLGVCPIITAALALTPDWHEHLRVGMTIVQINPAYILEYTRGPWFWLHTAYCYSMVLISLGVALARHWRLPKAFKRASKLLITGMVSSIAVNYLSIFGVIPAGVDCALMGVTVSGLFMFAATRQNRGMDFVNQARIEAFNSLGSGVIILDGRGAIRGFNANGRRFMAECGVQQIGNFEQVLQALRAAAWKIEPSEEKGDVDYYIESRVFNIRHRPIYDKREREIGAFVVTDDVTDNRRLIRRLEEDAGMDALTGLFNRMRMDEMRGRLDNEENYPLAVIMGDMNGLKEVNDTYGHQQGDVLLRLAAEILSAVCPPKACVGRVGGDEFMILLPGCTWEQAQELMDEILNEMRAATGYRYEVSMALGMAVKERADQSMDATVARADAAMYAHKRLQKEARECGQQAEIREGQRA